MRAEDIYAARRGTEVASKEVIDQMRSRTDKHVWQSSCKTYGLDARFITFITVYELSLDDDGEDPAYPTPPVADRAT